MTFEEILASTVDEDEDYQQFKNDGLNNTLNPLDMGLILAGQPIGVLEDLTAKLDEETWSAKMEVEPTGAVEGVIHAVDVEDQVNATRSIEVEVRGVKETLT